MTKETQTLITVALIGFAVIAWLWPVLLGITASWLPFIFAYGNMAVLCVVVIYKHRKDKKQAKLDAEDGAP